ncbi:hypothetical protein D9619_002433 [Psilocybe cf. subviscida]|uniref:Yeast cell wall synthesis Kre9/Knh1-like N-terminal domain-containing protein n=1 Tax=Psilocybe cf. subviscida TaxID=2480587 RepID=A0A8H5ETS3_9AGAR|nr:hypothetical protein D9619_002433 [Psilocybe cf. subviscida]
MFTKLSLLALAAPLLVSALQLAIPENPTNSGTITIKWTNEPNDPDTWSFELINKVFNNAFAIANNINPSASQITLTLPVVPVGAGYTLQAVNIGNITDVFAETPEFSIGAATTTLSSSAASTTASSGSATRSGTISSVRTTGSPTPSVPVSNTGFSSNIVTPTPTPTAPATTGSTGTASGSTTGGNAAVTPFSAGSRISSLGGSVGGFAAVLLSAIAGAAMIAL